MGDLSEQLTQLAKLRADGALTEEEFKALKAKIIYGTKNSIASVPKAAFVEESQTADQTAPAQTTEYETASPKPDHSEMANGKQNRPTIRIEWVVWVLGVSALIIVVLIFSSLQNQSPGSLKDAVAAYGKGDYATALRLLRPLADQDNANAQFSLGTLYYKGRGVRLGRS